MTLESPVVPSSSLSVLEEFYGDLISQELIRRIRDTPAEQILELAYRLDGNRQWAEHFLGSRRNFRFGKQPALPPKDSDGATVKWVHYHLINRGLDFD